MRPQTKLRKFRPYADNGEAILHGRAVHRRSEGLSRRTNKGTYLQPRTLSPLPAADKKPPRRSMTERNTPEQRAMVIAGLAKDIDEVALYAAKLERVVKVARELYEESLERNGPMEGARFGPALAALDASTREGAK